MDNERRSELFDYSWQQRQVETCLVCSDLSLRNLEISFY